MGNYVTAFCRIVQKKIVLNGKRIFEESESSLDDFLFNAYNSLQLNYPKYFKMDNLSKAGLLASEVLFQYFNPTEKYKSHQIAVVLSNYNSSLDTDLKYRKSTESIPSPALFVYTLPNIVTGEICIRNGFKGENGFFIQKSFNPDFLAKYVDSLLQGPQTQACLAGWVNVLGDNHDVFLYLVEKTESGNAFNHTAKELMEKYETR